jgi:hypothetical protein
LKGLQLSVYTDEDVSAAVAEALRRRGFKAWSTQECGNFKFDDDEQLRFAGSLHAILLTHNVKDFPRIHYEFIDRGESHNGIVVAKQIPIGQILRRVLHLAAVLSATDMANRLEYLSGWSSPTTTLRAAP